MNPVLLKSLIGVGALGATTAVSVGGYYWLASPGTIWDKLKEKTLVASFMKSDEDTENKDPWEQKMNSYKAGADAEAKKILSTENIKAKDLSDKCQEILKTSLKDSAASQKEKWAVNWCFKQT